MMFDISNEASLGTDYTEFFDGAEYYNLIPNAATKVFTCVSIVVYLLFRLLAFWPKYFQKSKNCMLMLQAS